MQKCWDVDPSKKPTMGELWNFAYKKSKKRTSLIERFFKLFDFSNDNNIISGSGGVVHHNKYTKRIHCHITRVV